MTHHFLGVRPPGGQRFRIHGGKSKKLNQFCAADKHGQVLEGVFELPGTGSDLHFAAKSSTEKKIPS
jgi:hypothetical protein